MEIVSSKKHVVYNESSVAVGGNCFQQETRCVQTSVGVGGNCFQQETQKTLGASKIAMEPFHPFSSLEYCYISQARPRKL